MAQPINAPALDQLFREARTFTTSARPWLRADVRVRQRQGRRRVLRRREAVLRLRPGVLPRRAVKSNFLCTLGYGDPSTLFPRLPRLPFNEACSLL